MLSPIGDDDDEDEDDYSGVFLNQPVKVSESSNSMDSGDTAPAFSIFDDYSNKERPRVEMSDDGSEYYVEDDNTADYYSKNNKLVVARENWFLKLLKPIAWLTLVFLLIAGGVFAAPFLFNWFNDNFQPEPVAVEPTEVIDGNPLVEGGGGGETVTTEEPKTEEYVYNSEITGASVGNITSGYVLNEGNSAVIPYVSEPASDSPLPVAVQLDSIQKTEEFGLVLNAIRTASIGEAVASGIPAAQAEQDVASYRLNFVKINLRYDGIPTSFTRPQLNGTFSLENNGGVSGINSTSDVLSYYTTRLQLSEQEAVDKIFEDYKCDVSSEIPDEFWEGGISIQKCYIVASNTAFNSFTYTHKDFVMTFNGAYSE